MDYENDPDFREWAEHQKAHVLPQMRESALAVSLVPEDVDIKFAVELGMSIMLDKPIIAVVPPGAKVPERLVRVADRIVEADLFANPKQAMERIKAATDELFGDS